MTREQIIDAMHELAERISAEEDDPQKADSVEILNRIFDELSFQLDECY